MNGLSDGFGLRHLIDAMRTGDLRGKRGGVKAVLRAEYGVRVTGIDGIVRDAARGEIRLRCFIHRHEADLCSHLNGHICDGHALVHGQGADCLAGIFHGLVCRARVADHTDGLERDVLGHHASGQRSLP